MSFKIADPDSLRKYDHLPPREAVVEAWVNVGDSPGWHAAAMCHVANVMPLLARAIERLALEVDPDRSLEEW